MEILCDANQFSVNSLEVGCNCGCAKINCSSCQKTGCDCGCVDFNCGS